MRVLQIGLGGENLVRFAAMTNELRHFNGRNGIGAVMGSKNLKAIAVRGTGRYSHIAHDAAALAELGRQVASQAKEHPLAKDTHDRGTPGMFETLNAAGILPTRNFRAGSYDAADSLKWAVYERDFLTGRGSCYACSVRCKREIAVDGKTRASLYDGPEYEAMAGFGSNCLNADLNIVMKANEMCNIYALDAISTAMAITFGMECFESGLISLEDTGGIELRFGNGEAILPLIEKIAHRDGIGDLLAEGTLRAARKIGGGAEAFPIEVKGQELPMHDPRGKTGIGIGFAVSEGGADHLVSFHDPTLVNPDSLSFQGARALGMVALPARDLSDQKVLNYFIGERWSSFEKCAGFCYFGPAPRSFIQAETVPEIVNAATGWGLSLPDLLEIGERATTLARLFNLREGFTPKDDRLPERMFMPSEAGTLAGKAIDRAEFERALVHLYGLKDWDVETGMPSAERLQRLGLEWAAAAMKG